MDWQNQCRTAPPQSLGWDEWTGSPSSFSFSNDGLSVVLLMSKCADACFGHESIFVADLEGDREIRHVHISKPSENSKPRIWDPRIVSVFRSSSNLDVLYAVVDAEGQMGVWKINMFPEQDRGIIKALAKPLLEHGSTTFLCCLGPPSVRDELLVSRSTFQRAGVVEIVTEDATSQLHIQTVDEYRVPQPPAISDQFYFPSAGGLMVQAFIHKPAHFTEDTRYPVVIIVHGGPNDAWRDCWLATWNHLAWTSQGFVVITPNIRGSTGFGLPFALSIYKDWGGSPLRDLEYLISFIEASMPFADLSRVIGAGYSYGGYLINWLAGQELSRRFCALIVHGGVFSPRNLMAGDFPLIYRQDFGCFPWEGRAEWDRWDPSLFCDKWTVPMLFTCGDVDYRVPVSETLAAYHACQIRGVPSQLLLFPDEGHRISKPANLAQWRETMLAWAIRWTAQ
ncbi:prolyl oligopeptidase [Colletotrichum navitas]|uniref:Dipeptidyl-peptidase V n=1 Tax=Colletotrichum navitas TaxID=681940 RepID=A0AAD8PIY3_9PEZI|nr:prolyl oligopeptidase [Colletotrichum navitas]KAK1564096.1 prolyl oligopeptidase [Colletotrichum navitas]